MEAGPLRHRVTLQRSSITRTARGGQREEFVDLFTCWAAIEPVSSREYWAAQGVNSDVTTRIRVRYRPGITAKMRVKFLLKAGSPEQAQYYDIEGVLEQLTRRREVWLMCRLRDAESFRSAVPIPSTPTDTGDGDDTGGDTGGGDGGGGDTPGNLIIWADGAYGTIVQTDGFSNNATTAQTADYLQVTTTGLFGLLTLNFTGPTVDGFDGSLDTSPYTSLRMDVMPIAPDGETANFSFLAVQVGTEFGFGPQIYANSYGGPFPVNVWTTLTIPLADLYGSIGAVWRKFGMQDQGSNSNNAGGGTQWRLRNVELVP